MPPVERRSTTIRKQNWSDKFVNSDLGGQPFGGHDQCASDAMTAVVRSDDRVNLCRGAITSYLMSWGPGIDHQFAHPDYLAACIGHEDVHPSLRTVQDRLEVAPHWRGIGHAMPVSGEVGVCPRILASQTRQSFKISMLGRPHR